jgi:uncharacterized protein
MDAPRRAGDPRPRRAMRVAWWLALCFALLAPPAFADVAVPTLTAHVTDLTGTLTPTQVQFLELRLANLEKRKGSQFLVLMLPTTQPEAIEEFSLKVAEKNRIGRKDVDDGLLLVVAKDDHKARIEVGYGLEGVVTDAISSRIIREYLAPKFRENDYAGGLDDATATLEKLIDGEPLPPPLAANDHAANDSPTWILALFIGAFVGLFAAGTRIKPALLRRIGAGGIAAAVALSMLGFGGALAVAAIVAFVVSGANGGSRYVGSGGPWIGGGGGGFGGGGFGGGGGGFSGGGGGFGGGGASGGW